MLGQVLLLSHYIFTSALLSLFFVVRVTDNEPFIGWSSVYRGADKSLARPGREQANVSVRMA